MVFQMAQLRVDAQGHATTIPLHALLFVGIGRADCTFGVILGVTWCLYHGLHTTTYNRPSQFLWMLPSSQFFLWYWQQGQDLAIFPHHFYPNSLDVNNTVSESGFGAINPLVHVGYINNQYFANNDPIFFDDSGEDNPSSDTNITWATQTVMGMQQPNTTQIWTAPHTTTPHRTPTSNNSPMLPTARSSHWTCSPPPTTR